MTTGLTEPELQECRDALKRLLESGTFAGSRRLSDFLAYAGAAAFEGRTELDQYEIADKVLRRPADFNPWDDATVRKLGTQLRHKLDEYYAGPGAEDRVIVSLPRRSYIPRFRQREELVAAEPDVPAISNEAPAAAIVPRQRHWGWLLAGFATGIAAASLVSLRSPVQTEAFSKQEIVIHTTKGDLRGAGLDIAKDAVQTGPEIRDGEEAMVRVRFTPDRTGQQAGLMAMIDADHFARLGQHFKNRTLIEFGTEVDGKYQTPTTAYAFDPLGQQGLARWMSIRRLGNEYRGFTSTDGFYWREFGSKLTLAASASNPRASIYAFNGLTANPSTTATFDQFGTAVAFHNREDGPFQISGFPGWKQTTNCASAVTANVKEEALQVGFADNALGCEWSVMRDVSAGDWAFSTMVDFEPVSGSSVGIRLNGTRGFVELSRRDLDGRSIMLERTDDRDSRIPDFPGSPPVILRLEKVGQYLNGSVTRDGNRFVPVGQIPVGELGELRRVGLLAGIAHWTSQISRPPARIYWMREEVVTPGRLTAGNVPSRDGT
jgi:hypothetical protein